MNKDDAPRTEGNKVKKKKPSILPAKPVRKVNPKRTAINPNNQTPCYPEAIKALAFDMYLKRELTLKGIAQELQLDFNTITCWHRDMHWASKRRKLAQKMEEDTLTSHEAWIITEREKATTRAIENSTLIDRHVKNALTRTKVGIKTLHIAAKSASLSAGIAGRALGLNATKQNSGKRSQLLAGYQPRQRREPTTGSVRSVKQTNIIEVSEATHAPEPHEDW